MIAIEMEVPTKGDIQAAEHLRERCCEINGKIHYLLHVAGALHEQVDSVIGTYTSAVALFESDSSSRSATLKREMAAMRCQLRRMKVARKIADVEDALDAVASELTELKMHDQLRGILDKCSD